MIGLDSSSKYNYDKHCSLYYLHPIELFVGARQMCLETLKNQFSQNRNQWENENEFWRIYTRHNLEEIKVSKIRNKLSDEANNVPVSSAFEIIPTYFILGQHIPNWPNKF